MHSETSATVPNGSMGQGSGAGEKRLEGASEVRGTGSGPGRAAADKLDGNQEAAGQDSAGAGPGPGPHADSSAGRPGVRGAAHTAAESLDHTAKYIREHDVASMVADVKRLVKDNPVPALIGAAILGFVLARTLSRD